MTNSFSHRVGYQLEIYGDVAKVEEKFLCSRCNLVLRNPVQIYCGHRLCNDCFQHSQFIDDKVCPGSRKDRGENCDRAFEQSFPDNAIKREMASMMAHCYFDGCSWIGPFKEFESRHYESCKFKPKECFVCRKALPQSQANNDGRIDESCLEHMNCFLKRLKKIDETLGCSNDNGVREATVRPILERISLIEQTVQQLQRELAAQNLSTQRLNIKEGENEQVVENGAMSLKQSEEKDPLLSGEVKVIEDVLVVLNREVEKLTGDMEAMERQRRLERDQVETIDRKMKSLERSLALKDVTITELEQRLTEMDQTSYDGTLLWKITDFNRRRQEAISGRITSFYSPPFYTSKTGYKMRARIYLNGDGIGKGSHVSLFFVVMRGHYDALLEWPFAHKVNLKFINQNNREHVTDSFRPDPTSSSFKRPTTEMNIASGCPLFMTLSQLDNPINAYVRDNVAFIRIIVGAED